MSRDERERCVRRGQQDARKEAARFFESLGAIKTEVSRKCAEPLVVVDLERGRGWMIPGAGLRVTAGDNIAIHSRRKGFKVFFSGFDRKGRLACELYMDDAHVRNRALGQGESLECKQDPGAPFRVTRRETTGKAGCATICVWADVPKRKIGSC
jgi:hypothetical protein